MTEQKPVRLPAPASVETVLAGLEPQSADVELSPALNKAFPGFVFTVANIDDPYCCNPHDVVAADGTRLGDHRAWFEHELAEVGGDLNAFWNRHRQSGEKFAEWRGTTAFAFAPTGPGVADFVQISLGREIEFLTGAVVDPDYRPRNVDDLFEPTWVLRGSAVEPQQLAGPVYRLRGRSGGGIVHMRSFLARRTRIERELREAQRPELENRVIREVGPDGTRDIAFFDANPDWFDFVPRESRFFVAWERSSAAPTASLLTGPSTSTTSRNAAGARSVLFRGPSKCRLSGLLADEGVSVYRLMERVEAIDTEIGLPFAWFFLMTHGHWVDPNVGHAIAEGLRTGRVRLPDQDAAVLLAWADRPYLF